MTSPSPSRDNTGRLKGNSEEAQALRNHVDNLSAKIEAILDGWGFKYTKRHCKVNPVKYGMAEDSDPYVEEDWSNADMARLITDELKSPYWDTKVTTAASEHPGATPDFSRTLQDGPDKPNSEYPTIDQAVDKMMHDYGETLRKLGKE